MTWFPGIDDTRRKRPRRPADEREGRDLGEVACRPPRPHGALWRTVRARGANQRLVDEPAATRRDDEGGGLGTETVKGVQYLDRKENA